MDAATGSGAGSPGVRVEGGQADPQPGGAGTPGSHGGGGGDGALPVESAIFSAYSNGLFLLSNYGWYLLLIVIVFFIVWANIKPSVERWLKKREERIEEENFDPMKAERFQDGVLRSREKMQRELDEKAKEHQEVVEERKAKERDEKIKQWEEFKVVTKPKRQPKPQDDSRRYNPPSRRDYFPLGGGGGGGGYRPSRRTFGGGG